MGSNLHVKLAAGIAVALIAGAIGQALAIDRASTSPSAAAPAGQTSPTVTRPDGRGNSRQRAHIFTLDQAKKRIENDGYANVSELRKGPDGTWRAKATTKGGDSVDVVITSDLDLVVTPRSEHATNPSQPKSSLPPMHSGPARLLIDNAIQHQVIEGFGASVTEWVDTITGNDQMGSMRPQILDAIYNQVKLTTGHLDIGPYENFNPANYTTSNDDGDPYNFNWGAFNMVRSINQKSKIVDLAAPMGFNNFMLHGGMNTRWNDRWLNTIKSGGHRITYLQEAAENVVAGNVYWRNNYGIVPIWHHLFNEPTSGNQEVSGAKAGDIVELVKTTGARFRREGFATTKFVVASEETEERSLATAKAILSDPTARQYVGAISYHTYPYGSIYCDIPTILRTSGAGKPDPGRIAIRNQIRDLAKRYGLQVWMTEVSHPNANTFDTMRGRAIHIHDELLYADASAYWGMWEAYDASASGADEDSVVLFDPRAQTFRITGMGYAIGHYSRWIHKGAIRLESTSDQSLIQISAFRDDSQGRLVFVVINNDAMNVPVTVSLKGLAFSALVEGERSSPEGYWISLPAVAPTTSSTFQFSAPGLSVTTFSSKFRN
jgi:O-glycosyl hydrolase